jgi:hypothetical protein
MGIKLWHLEYDTFEKRSGRENQRHALTTKDSLADFYLWRRVRSGRIGTHDGVIYIIMADCQSPSSIRLRPEGRCDLESRVGRRVFRWQGYNAMVSCNCRKRGFQ